MTSTDSQDETARAVDAAEACHRARALYGEGRLDDALRAFRDAASRGPLGVDDTIFRMRAEYRLERFDDALATIDRILEDRPGQAEALKTGGRIANRRNDVARAPEFWRRLSDADPGDPDGPLQMARIAMRDGEFTDAAQWGRRLLGIVPSHAEGLGIVILAALRIGELADIGEFLAEYFTLDRARALDLLRLLSRMPAYEIYAAALSAIARRASGDDEIAALAVDARDMFRSGGLHSEIQSLNEREAAKFYRAIRVLDPSDRIAEQGLERLRRDSIVGMRESLGLRQPEETVRCGRQAVAIDPDCFEAWLTMGRTHLATNDLEAARGCLREATRLDGRNAWAWLNYARVLDRLDDWQEALAAYRRVIAPESLGEADQLAESGRAIRSLYAKALHAARDAAARRDVETAWRHYSVAAAIEPDNDNVAVLKRGLLAAMYEAIRDLWQAGSPDAIEACRLYLERAPDNIYVLQVFGRSLMNARRFAEARPAWERLALLEPEDAHPRLQIARCCDWLNLREAGAAAARDALRLDPTLAEAQSILEKLGAPPTPA